MWCCRRRPGLPQRSPLGCCWRPTRPAGRRAARPRPARARSAWRGPGRAGAVRGATAGPAAAAPPAAAAGAAGRWGPCYCCQCLAAPPCVHNTSSQCRRQALCRCVGGVGELCGWLGRAARSARTPAWAGRPRRARRRRPAAGAPSSPSCAGTRPWPGPSGATPPAVANGPRVRPGSAFNANLAPAPPAQRTRVLASRHDCALPSSLTSVRGKLLTVMAGLLMPATCSPRTDISVQQAASTREAITCGRAHGNPNTP